MAGVDKILRIFQGSEVAVTGKEEQSFSRRVYDIVRQIPRGEVATYGQVARLAGSPRSARYVGFVLHANPYQGVVPCHRVVFKSGALAPGFAFGGPDKQRRLLESEGVLFSGDRVDLSRCLWDV
jgi:methylated-DNA-protein-cysteine methyltransferase-like protein